MSRYVQHLLAFPSFATTRKGGLRELSLKFVTSSDRRPHFESMENQRNENAMPSSTGSPMRHPQKNRVAPKDAEAWFPMNPQVRLKIPIYQTSTNSFTHDFGEGAPHVGLQPETQGSNLENKWPEIGESYLLYCQRSILKLFYKTSLCIKTRAQEFPLSSMVLVTANRRRYTWLLNLKVSIWIYQHKILHHSTNSIKSLSFVPRPATASSEFPGRSGHQQPSQDTWDV